jgi:murein hydrolase activator
MVNRLAALALGLLLGLGLAPTTSAQGRTSDQAKTEAELRQIRSQINKIREQVTKDALQRDRLARELKKAEDSVGGVRGELERLRRERGEREERRRQLAADRREREAEIAAERRSLAGQIRAAHLIGREEPLKLLLNQRDPALVQRMFVYYQYFGRARAEQIATIEARVAEIAAIDADLELEEQKLAALEQAQKGELQRLQAARDERGKVLAALTSESKSRQRELARLKTQQTSLERVLREIRRAMERMEKFPVDSKDAFAKLRGKLAWPAGGRVVARYGQTRAGGIKWDGMLLAGQQGAPVRAVYHGRIVYADWLPGLGLLTIIDHGEGYLSLYGHNERLYKTVGERVRAGDQIASVGDTGGRAQPELYFEIRKGGRPVDPRPWFRSAAPGG